MGNFFVLLKGLKPHQTIVTSANFLIDSESQLQAAAGSFMPPPPGASRASQPSSSPIEVQDNIEFTTDPNPPHKGTNTFRVALTGPGKTPVAGAEVTVTFTMPATPAMGMAGMHTAVNLNDKATNYMKAPARLVPAERGTSPSARRRAVKPLQPRT